MIKIGKFVRKFFFFRGLVKMVRGRKKSSQDETGAEATPSRRSSRSSKKVSYSEEAEPEFESIPPGQLPVSQTDDENKER